MTDPVDAEPDIPAEESYLTLTGMLIAFAFWMGAGWLVGGSVGMLVAAVLVTLRYLVAIWYAAYPGGAAGGDQDVKRDIDDA